MRHKLNLVYHLQLGVMLAPYALGALVLIILPILLTFGLAFVDYYGFNTPHWVGLANLNWVLADPLEGVALGNSLYFLFWSVPLRMMAALLLALLLTRSQTGVGFYRAAVYLPTVMPEAVYALLWLWIVNPLYGPLNWILRGLGLPAPAWLADAATAKWVFVMMSVFQVGESFVVLIAGLKSIPLALYDAAVLDGATAWQSFWQITAPLLAPWFILLTFRDVIFSFQNTFTANLIMTRGDPYYATLFLPLLIYEEAFDHFRPGVSAVMLIFMFAVTAVLTALLYFVLPRFEMDHDL